MAVLAAWHRSAGAAASFTVDDLADAGDAAPGDGACASDRGTCTLRAAVQEKNAEQARLEPLPPPREPSTGRPGQDHRAIVDDLLWLGRAGAPWRELPGGYWTPRRAVARSTLTVGAPADSPVGAPRV